MFPSVAEVSIEVYHHHQPPTVIIHPPATDRITVRPLISASPKQSRQAGDLNQFINVEKNCETGDGILGCLSVRVSERFF
jgi:hypothetical protein